MSASRHTATGQSESAKSDVHDDASMSDLETRLFELKKVLATAQRGTVAYLDALSAARHLERVLLGRDALPPIVCRHEPRRGR